MRQVLCFVYTPIRYLIILICAPLLTLMYWVLAAVVIPLYIFQKLVSFFAHLVDPDLCKVVNSMGHITGRDYDEWFTCPSQVVTIILKLKGSPTIHELRQLVLHKWILKWNGNHQHLEYPEMQQYVTKRMGYLFFKWDRSFDICNHVNIYSNKDLHPNPQTSVVNETKLMKIWESVIKKPLMEKRSPWEALLISDFVPHENTLSENDNTNNYEHQTIVVLRVHHALCDGISIYKLLLTLTDYGLVNLEEDVAPFRKAPSCFDTLLHLKAFFCGPASLVMKASIGFDVHNPLHCSLGKKTGRLHICRATIDLETVKNIVRLNLDVTLHSVIMAALTGGIRNYLIGNGHQIPLSPIRVGLPIPKPGHSHKLRNEYLSTFLNLPVHKRTAKQRLFAVEKQIIKISRDAFLPFMVQTWQILGLFPLKVMRFLTLKSAVTVLYSEMKGPSKSLTIVNEKYELLDLMFSFGLGTDDLGVALSVISYKGKLHLVLTVDHAVAKTRDKAQQLMNLIMKEFDELQYGDSTNL